ncbi:unnamed protein product [Rotaria magnacalcarata]|uniref:Uncharacterized protein n=2 Tax=Rotaria magnacalcarata TaxID=392030 RepID=A0A816WF19_9BILA|nr:unnamed protein product [Rotaria magnacalcarata]
MDTAETSIDIATEEQSIEVKTDNSAENESTNDTSNLDKTEPVPIDVPVNPEKIEIARLSSIITKQTNEISDLNARLAACQQHYETLLNRQKEENSREKQSTVMRYAQAEKAKLDSDKRCEVLATKNNDLLKEKDNLQVKLSEFKLMNTKLQNAYEHKLSELAALKKELEKTKEINQSIDASLKSTLNHLKGESSHLKEQRESNERLRRDLNEQHELNEQLKLQCKQLTEAAQAIPTDDEHAQAFDTLHNEHNALKGKLTNIQDENKLLREKLKSSDEDRLALENVIENFRQTTMREKETTKKLYDDLLAAREQDSVEMSRLKQIEFLYNQTLADNADLRQLLEKEHQLLELTQKLTEKNSILQSDYEQLQLLHKGTSTDFECIQKINEEQKSQIAKLENIEKSLRDQLKELDEKYQTVNKLYEQTVKQYDDSLSEIQTLKKKHQANTKDLIKQLQQLQKPKSTNNSNEHVSMLLTSQTKHIANKENSNDNSSSRGSPTGSFSSLNEITSLTIPGSDHIPRHTPAHQQQQQQQLLPDEEQEVIVNIVDIDRQKLIDKLLKQQKLLVRRNEKIEFLNDHIQLLTQDLQNKRKIIQTYAMNEDSFMYTSAESDSIRQQLANKNRNNSSSLMATLYNRATTTVNHTTNKLFEQSSPMTLETALDVMGKLQSVLEDTLLKNITLKENVDTLNKKMPIVKSASTISESTTNEAREALDCLHELSQLLNTGLDKKTLTACVRLLEAGVHPDALAQIVQVLRSETRPTKL